MVRAVLVITISCPRTAHPAPRAEAHPEARGILRVHDKKRARVVAFLSRTNSVTKGSLSRDADGRRAGRPLHAPGLIATSHRAIRARGATHCVRPQLGEMWIRALERGEGAPRDVRPHRAKVNFL